TACSGEKALSCPECSGKGRITCTGTHRCAACLGIGTREDGRDCLECARTGQVEGCNGQGLVPCQTCLGTGQLSCPRCLGTGDAQTQRHCDSCHGKGTCHATCSACNGAGQTGTNCRACGGTGLSRGYEACQGCSGTGLKMLECSRCGGTGGWDSACPK